MAFPKLTRADEIMIDHIEMPWREAGAMEKPRKAVEPHKCRIIRRKTTIHGERVTVEIRK